MPRLMITGDRSNGRLLVIRDGDAIWLTANQYAVLLQLAYRRLTSTTGFASSDPYGIGESLINPVSILRLRRLIGDEWIETGLSCEYRLRLDPGEIRIEGSFQELPNGVIPAELKSGLAQFATPTSDPLPHRPPNERTTRALK